MPIAHFSELRLPLKYDQASFLFSGIQEFSLSFTEYPHFIFSYSFCIFTSIFHQSYVSSKDVSKPLMIPSEFLTPILRLGHMTVEKIKDLNLDSHWHPL